MANEIEWFIEFTKIRGEYSEVINWLIDNVEDVCERQTKGEFIGRPKPYHFSSISQFARFRGITNKWFLEIRGNNQTKIVKLNELVPKKIIVEFALKYT